MSETARASRFPWIVNALGKLNWGKRACAVCVLCATTAIALPAQTFTTLVNFDATNGAYPAAGLVQATNGDFYGTTVGGGANNTCTNNYYGHGCGTVFKVTSRGTLTTLHSFNSTDGAYPMSGLVQAISGDLYGTTSYGGAYNAACGDSGIAGCGTVFRITPGGKLTTLHSFNGTDGAFPNGLIQAANGNLYGTTAATVGGFDYNCTSSPGCGGVFKITPEGTFSTLYSFCAQTNCSDGGNPQAGLIQATNGFLYGTTFQGGANAGTIFKMTPGGVLTTIYDFCSQANCSDGPAGSLVQATKGSYFYGTTGGGGAGGQGTIFRINSANKLTTLHSFSGGDGGGNPVSGLVEASDGRFYGTTELGGTSSNCYFNFNDGCGTIFKIAPPGIFTTVYNFGSTDGEDPGALVQGTDGNLYGTTYGGGANSYGTIFSLSVGLGPFVETLPTSGKVGAAIKILGTDLTGAASVTFNGTAAPFTVDSPSLITTTVPTGATTGTVQVVTPSGTLSSNVPFRVP